MIGTAINLAGAAEHGATPEKDAARAWRQLHYLNLYRLTLAGLFLALALWNTAAPLLGRYAPELFRTASLALLLVSIAASITIRWRWPALALQHHLQTLVDVIAITVIMHSCGGVGSGLGMLLVIPIAGTAIILEGRSANLAAALATLATLTEQTYSQLQGVSPTSYTHAGLLGMTFFATAVLSHVLTARLRESERLAVQRGIDLANMAQLNEYVIQRMQAGVMVVDAQNRIRLINQSAWGLLGMPATQANLPLQRLSPELAQQLQRWRDGSGGEAALFHAPGSSADVLPRFLALGPEGDQGVLVFLEDSSQLAQQAQQLKLASLGRLTASIAHEIRNPLGAISHAAQLLGESELIDKPDARLIEIIRNHSSRMNTIIENILQLSRRKNFQPTAVNLGNWLEKFVAEFAQSQQVDPAEIAIAIEPPQTEVFLDPTQLQQVLWNLCQNGLRHSRDYLSSPKLELRGGIAPESQAPFLDIVDHGPGIDPQHAQHIFEPFFTTEKGGTGLGLYIARELCEVNRARLDYLAAPGGGSCFRITFSPIE